MVDYDATGELLRLDSDQGMSIAASPSLEIE
jgi:hypothetical protein